jgi:hypothetical protein
MIADQIRQLAGEAGIPVLGVGPASAMAAEAAGHRPASARFPSMDASPCR